jgi:Fe-S cluster assembly protein SufD
MKTTTPQRYGTAIHLTPPWGDVREIPTPAEALAKAGPIPEGWRERLEAAAEHDVYLAWHLEHELPVTLLRPSGYGGRAQSFSEVLLIELTENQHVVLEDHLVNHEAALRRIFIRQEKNSQFEYIAWRTKNNFLSEEVYIDLVGEGASAKTTHLLYGQHKEQADIGVRVTHRAPRTQSLLRSRAAADNKAQSIYRGLITIEQTAPGSSGYQHSDNLLLSDDATIDSLPELAIQTDDVSCTHGVTTTSLDEATLLYARSRGLSEAEATKMAIIGFYNHQLTLPLKTSEAMYAFLA